MSGEIGMARQLIFEFLETASLVEKRLDRVLANTRGISFSEYRLLCGLAAMPSVRASRVDLASFVGLTASAVTRALKPLEKLGYVVTEKSDRDARQSLAMLTRQGMALLSDAHALLEDVLADSPLNRLGPSEVANFRSRLEELGKRP